MVVKTHLEKLMGEIVVLNMAVVRIEVLIFSLKNQ